MNAPIVAGWGNRRLDHHNRKRGPRKVTSALERLALEMQSLSGTPESEPAFPLHPQVVHMHVGVGDVLASQGQLGWDGNGLRGN